MTKQNLITRLAGVAGAGLIVANTLVPAFAAINISISGNGADSNNETELDYSASTVVSQSNQVSVKNDIDQEANTGDNKVEKNTGASIDVTTGDVDQSADVSTMAGVNSAEVDGCGSCDLDLGIAIEKNGADTKNKVEFDYASDRQLYQDNNVYVKNDVDQEAETGDNEIEKNTNGDISLTTGDVEQDATLHTEAGANAASLGGGNGVNLDLSVMENGADSRNKVEVGLEMATTVVQDNTVDVANDVDQEAKTGDNEIEDNTGGDVDVETGDVAQAADVWNAAGYNALSIDDCCELDGDVVVDKNGADTKNEVELSLDFLKEFFQNCGGMEKPQGLLGFFGHRFGGCDLNNDVEQEAATGDNNVEENTGDDLTTGDVMQESTAHNEAGANVIGNDGHTMVAVDYNLLMQLLDLLFN